MTLRRLQNEIIRIHDQEMNDYDKLNYFLTDNSGNELRFIMFITSKIIYFIKIIYPSTYPFRPPKVIITDNEGSEKNNYLCSIRQINVYKKGQKSCLCCESLMCGNNWGSINTTFDIMNELNDNFQTLHRNIVSASHNSVVRQKMGVYAGHFMEYGQIRQFLA